MAWWLGLLLLLTGCAARPALVNPVLFGRPDLLHPPIQSDHACRAWASGPCA